MFSLQEASHLFGVLFIVLMLYFTLKVLFTIIPIYSERKKIVIAFSMFLATWAVAFAKVYVFFPFFNPDSFLKATHFVAIFFSAYFLIQLITFFIWNGLVVAKTGFKPPAILTATLHLIVYVLTLLLSAKTLYGLPLTPFFAASGVLTLVLGYASQQTLGNIFSGLAIQFGGKLKKGNHVVSDQFDGYVYDFSWRSVTIRGFRDYVVPNTIMANHIHTLYNPVVGQAYPISIAIKVALDANLSLLTGLIEKTIKESSPLGLGVVGCGKINQTHINIYAAGQIYHRDQEWEMRFFFNSAILGRALKNNIYLGVNDFNHPSNQSYTSKLPSGPSKSEIESILKSMPVFSGFTDNEYDVLFQYSKLQLYFHGEVIMNQAEKGDSLFVLLKGDVRNYEWNAILGASYSERTTMRELTSCDVFGIKCFLLNTKRRVTTRAISKTVWALEVNRDVVQRLEQSKSVFLDHLMGILQQREQENGEYIIGINKKRRLEKNTINILKNKVLKIFFNK